VSRHLQLIGLLSVIGSSIVVIGVISSVYKDFILNSSSGSSDTVITRTNSSASSIGGHVPGYPIGDTSGTIIDPIEQVVDSRNSVVDPDKYLREFNYGRVSTLPNGTTLREFTLVASDQLVKEVSPGVFYNVWTFNGTVPGPTIRATEGDIVRINFVNNGSMPHSLHTHGIHPAEMDGVFEMISPGGKFTYEFVAEPFGVFPYHCHMTPLEEHIAHGLYGVYIVDPKTPRPPADEMVMVMNGYDTDFDTENNFYTVNGIPYYYMHHPIQIEKDKPVRIYLVNMLEFDPLNNLHLHANMFNYYPSGTNLQPDELTDIVSLNQGERGIMEFEYKYPGKYMFHAHKTEFAEKGWMGTFFVNDKSATQNSSRIDNSPYDTLNNSFVTRAPEIDGGRL
jgi:manganese oxidase